MGKIVNMQVNIPALDKNNPSKVKAKKMIYFLHFLRILELNNYIFPKITIA